jgi:hypothetical protein
LKFNEVRPLSYLNPPHSFFPLFSLAVIFLPLPFVSYSFFISASFPSFIPSTPPSLSLFCTIMDNVQHDVGIMIVSRGCYCIADIFVQNILSALFNKRNQFKPGICIVLTLWNRGSFEYYLRIQSIPQREHHISPLQRSTG